MTNAISIDEKYSTTKLLTKEKPVVENKLEDKFETVLFLPEGENRKGEGGLRTKGYFKKSYENKPLISIITVVFNGEKYLEQTIQSVINQSYDNVEYIIVDGGSTDGTVDIIKKYEEQIDYWVSEEDKGIYDAMNKGIDLVTGDWINFMNASDGFVDEKVLIKVFNDNITNVDLIYGAIVLKDENMKSITNVYPKKFNRFNLLFWGTGTLCHQAMFINKRRMEYYSLNFGLKGELSWYFSLVKKIKNYKKLDFVIVNYSLGGKSSVDFKKNIREVLVVSFKRNGIFGVVSLPLLAYSFIKNILRNKNK